MNIKTESQFWRQSFYPPMYNDRYSVVDGSTITSGTATPGQITILNYPDSSGAKSCDVYVSTIVYSDFVYIVNLSENVTVSVNFSGYTSGQDLKGFASGIKYSGIDSPLLPFYKAIGNTDSLFLPPKIGYAYIYFGRGKAIGSDPGYWEITAQGIFQDTLGG